MKNFLWAGLSLFAAVLPALAGCVLPEAGTEGGSAGTLTLMTWNVNNLFDGADNGYEYDEFLQSSGWSAEKYLGRINSVSGAIGKVEPQPDIIMFQEIESSAVLEDIAGSLQGGYDWSHFANNPGASVGLGILSRIPLSQIRVHSITIGSETIPRPVLEARVSAGEGEFIVFVCHWKSKLGGDEVTESVRKASARVILRRIRELLEEEPETGVIVAGDLNENYDEFSRHGGAVISALLPDEPYPAQLTGCIGGDGSEEPGLQKDFIVISGNKPPFPDHFPAESVVLFSPWMADLENGSYYYKNDWETIDHFLISGQFFNDDGWEYERAVIMDHQPFANSGGMPMSYNARTGSGLSDHLPLLLTLRIYPKDLSLKTYP